MQQPFVLSRAGKEEITGSRSFCKSSCLMSRASGAGAIRRALAVFAAATAIASSPRALANSPAPYVREPTNLGGAFILKQTSLVVEHEDLTFRCERDRCTFSATYAVFNPGEAREEVLGAFYGEGASGEVAIQADGIDARHAITEEQKRAILATIAAIDPEAASEHGSVEGAGFTLAVDGRARRMLSFSGTIFPVYADNPHASEGFLVLPVLQARHPFLSTEPRVDARTEYACALSPIRSWASAHAAANGGRARTQARVGSVHRARAQDRRHQSARACSSGCGRRRAHRGGSQGSREVGERRHHHHVLARRPSDRGARAARGQQGGIRRSVDAAPGGGAEQALRAWLLPAKSRADATVLRHVVDAADSVCAFFRPFKSADVVCAFRCAYVRAALVPLRASSVREERQCTRLLRDGGTYLATFRAVAKKYPAKSPRAVLELLVAATPGDEGKWFAAAKDAGLFEESIALARSTPCDPRTLARAARDHVTKQAAFAIEAGVIALDWIAQGYGYEITSADVWAAYVPARDAAERLGRGAALRRRVGEIGARYFQGENLVARVLGAALHDA